MDDARRDDETTTPLPHYRLDDTRLSTVEAFEQWRAAAAPIFEVGLEHGDGLADFGISFDAYDLGAMVLGHARGAGTQIFNRNRPTVARSGVDHFLVQGFARGTYHIDAEGEELTVRAGDVWLLDMGRTVSSSARDFDSHSLALPRALIEPLVRDADLLHGLHLTGDTALGGLLFDHIAGLGARASRMTSSDATAVIDSTLHLIAGCVGPAADARDAAADGIGSALLARLRRSIDRNLADPDLGPELLIRRHGVSRARLYRLFEPLGGVAEHIRRRRLRRCFLDLSSASTRDLRIAEIGRRWGFSNEAAFSRTFKACYGLTPSEVRHMGDECSAQLGPEGLAPSLRRWMNDLMGV